MSLNRRTAGALHLAVSLALTAAVFFLAWRIWYPIGLFSTAGGVVLFLVIAATNLVAALLTFIIFVPRKKGLVFDLVVIALVQVAALAYGLHVLHDSRPAFLVFVKDRFELVRANEIAAAELAKARRGPYGEVPAWGPKVVGARVPSDADEVTRIIFASSLGGVDLQHFPQHYVDYAAVRAEALRRAGAIARLRALNPQAAGDIDGIVSGLDRAEKDLAFLPFRADKRELTALIDAKDGDLLKVVALRPW